MSAAALLSPSTKTDLGSGLARYSTSGAHGCPLLATTHREYRPPPPGTERSVPVRPPPPASVMHRNLSLPRKETQAAHTAHERTVRTSTSAMALNAYSTHFHLSADRRLETMCTTMQDAFRPSARMRTVAAPRKPANANRFTHVSVSEALARPEYSSAFSSHLFPPAPQHRRSFSLTENAGCCPLTGTPPGSQASSQASSGAGGSQTSSQASIGRGGSQASSGGGGRGEYQWKSCDELCTTTNCATYRGHQVQESRKVSEKARAQQLQLSSIPCGDLATVRPQTTHQTSYTAPLAPSPPPHTPYSRSAAVEAILTSSVHLGGSPQISGFHTTVQDTFSEPQTSIRTRPVPQFPRNASFMSAGDLEPARARQRISHTTTKDMHPAPPKDSYPAHVDSSHFHTHSHLHLGSHRPSISCNSTMADSFLPLTAVTHRVHAPRKDNIPFDYYSGHLSNSTTAASYPTHPGTSRAGLNPAALSNLKCSHWQLSTPNPTRTTPDHLPPLPAKQDH